jgi:hypothetical protein
LVVVLAATIFLFVLGSGSVERLRHLGSTGRWAGLFVLWFIAVALAIRAGRHRLPALPVFFVIAAALPVLGLASSAWSVDPRLTAERAVSLGIVVTAGAALAYASYFDKAVLRAVVVGIVTGASLAALGGALYAMVSLSDAVQSAGPGVPWRLKGLGENPNTFCMLAAVALPLATGLFFRLESRMAQALVGVGWLALYGSIVLSGSRGAFAAGFAGLFVVGITLGADMRARFAGAGASVLAAVVGLGLGVTIPHGLPVQVTAPPPPAVSTGTLPGQAAVYDPGRLQDELDREAVAPSFRKILSSSGRVVAWRGAIHQARARPLLGFGFGTEHAVFIDRFFFFDGGVPENAWVGIALQLGVAGVAVLLAFWIAVGAAARRVARNSDPVLMGLVGAAAAGFLLMVGQSYIYSVGNVATVSVWLCAMLLVAATVPRYAERA